MKNLFILLSYVLYIYKRNQSSALLLQALERLKGDELLFFFTFLVLRKRSP